MLEREAKVDQTKWKEFASLIGSLPLEKCNREICNPFTGEQGWMAPKDKAFRISGHFVVDSSESDVEDHVMPLASADVLKEEYTERYKEFLTEAKGNECEALNLLIEDIFDGYYSGTPMNFFDGKWLIILPDLGQLPSDKGNKLEAPELMVKDNIEVWPERDFFQIIHDITPQSPTITEVFLERQARAIMHWKQHYARATLGKCKIELIDSPEKEKESYEFKPEDNSNLYLPEGTRKKGVYSDYEFAMKARRRPNKKEEKQLETFNKNGGLVFSQPWNSDVLIAQRPEKIILPEKKKKERKSQNIPF